MCGVLLRSALQRVLPEERSLPDEREIVKTQDQDMAILVSVDAIQANDELLFTAMLEAFYYGRPDWTDVVDFVLQLLAHRLPTVAESNRVLLQWPFPDAFPLRNMRPQIVGGIIKILSEHVARMPTGYTSIFPIDPRRATANTHILCMHSLIIAVADLDIELVTSNSALLNHFRLWFLGVEGGESLWADWAHMTTMGEGDTQCGLSPSLTTKPVGRLLRLMTEAVEPANIRLPVGVRIIEALTASRIDDWGQTIEWSALPMDLDVSLYKLGPSESFLQALLLSEFQQRVSANPARRSIVYYPSTSQTLAGRVLSAILRSVLQEQSGAMEQYFSQQISLEWLACIVELVTHSESCTEYFIDVLLDHGIPNGHPNSIVLLRLLDSYHSRDGHGLSRIRVSGR